MNTEENYESQIIESIQASNKYEYFKLFFSDEIIDYFVSESNDYYEKILKNKYGNDFKQKIFELNSYNIYPYLYLAKGITKDDITCFIGIKISCLHKFPSLECYWSNDILYNNIVNNLFNKAYYFLLSNALHFPEKEANEIDKGNLNNSYNIQNEGVDVFD